MDTKKAIATLLKIAENQQKIINKLAQMQPPPAHMAPNDHLGQHVSPEEQALKDAALLKGHVDHSTVVDVQPDPSDSKKLVAVFAKGKMSQPAYDKALAALQGLINSNQINTAYNLGYKEA